MRKVNLRISMQHHNYVIDIIDSVDGNIVAIYTFLALYDFMQSMHNLEKIYKIEGISYDDSVV